MSMKNSWQVATAAEAFAAAQFARLGWDVSVQYGANQPEYDLVAVDDDRMLKISVKGSKDGGWALTHSFISEANYHDAADAWFLKHSRKTLFCFVQFADVPATDLPRMYLATPSEIVIWLKAAAAGRGDTVLYEEHAWTPRAQAAGTIDRIPEAWKFTENRLDALARIMLNSLEKTAAPIRSDTALMRRSALIQRFVSGEWGVELSGYEHARAADRAEARGQAGHI